MKLKDVSKWLTVNDISVNQRMESGPYKHATITNIAKNGWVSMKWDDGRTFSVRVQWLTDNHIG